MFYASFKRLLDISVSLIVLVITLPFFALALALVFLDGQTQPIFTQRRLGLGGKEFTIYKFRTMKSPPSDAPPIDIKPDAPELTAIGRFLRNTSLDELPQLFNILIGDMSLIGPRPYAIKHGERYAAIDPRYYERYRVRPGLACIVEVTRLHYLTETRKHFKTRINCDLYYIRHQSLSLDFKIFLKTLRCVLQSHRHMTVKVAEHAETTLFTKFPSFHAIQPKHVQRVAGILVLLFCIAPS